MCIECQSKTLQTNLWPWSCYNTSHSYQSLSVIWRCQTLYVHNDFVEPSVLCLLIAYLLVIDFCKGISDSDDNKLLIMS